MKLQRAIALVVVASCLASAEAQAAEPSGGSGQEEFDRHYIGFDDVGTFDPRTGLLYKVTEPYEGKYKKPMAPVEFYRRIGREDHRPESRATAGSLRR
jgi:hypothetical protein